MVGLENKMRFEFATATKVVFGQGTINEAAPAARLLGQRAVVVTGKSGRLMPEFVRQLENVGVSVSEIHVSGEPTVAVVTSGLEQAKDQTSDLVIGIGGGSVLDTAKAIAGLASNPGSVTDYLELVEAGKPLTNPSLPYIAIPTTAGTGSEVTCNAVLAVPERRIKVSLRSPKLLPRLAIIDPELTYTLPPEITAASGLDALTQLIEGFLSNQSNPLTEALCREGLRRASRSLRLAFEDSGNASARADMSLSSLLSGMVLANIKLGAVHGLAGPIGGMFTAPHGAICARLLAVTMETNLRTLRTRSAQHPAVTCFAEIGQLLTGDAYARAEDGIEWLHELCEALNIPPLATYGIREPDFEEIAQKAMRSSSMKGNPIALTEHELIGILAKAL
jgi:alcohol dehydrogenase class IV